MKKTRRNFILTGTVSLTGLIAGCVGSDQSGSEPTSQDPTTSDTQSVSETPTNAQSSTTKSTSETRTDTSTPTPNASTETTSEITRATSSRATQTSVTGTVSHALRDVRIYNETSTTLKVTVTISRLLLSWDQKTPGESTDTTVQKSPDIEQVLSDTFELPPGAPPEYESRDYQNPFKPEKTYSIRVSVRNGPTRTYRFGESRDGKGLIIYIRENAIEFMEIIG